MSRIDRIWAEFERWLGRNHAEVLASLPRGATDDEISRLERAVGVTLPSDLATSLRRHDGAEEVIPDYGSLLSADGIYQSWSIAARILKDGDVGFPSPDPECRVQTVWWDDRWIPIAADGGGNQVAIDLNPGTGGQEGQILDLENSCVTRPVIAPNFGDWLESRFSTVTQRGEYVYFEGELMLAQDVEIVRRMGEESEEAEFLPANPEPIASRAAELRERRLMRQRRRPWWRFWDRSSEPGSA